MSFEQLPYDLLPPILSCLEGTRSYVLLPCCLVNHDFYEVAVKLLYRRINIYHWHINPKYKVGTLFRTLAHSTRIASFVEAIDLTGFPREVLHDTTDLHKNLIPALLNCVNLYSCKWTRDGTLTNSIIGALQRVPLRELTINGRTGVFYNAKNLMGFNKLTKLTIIMPDGDAAHHLPRWSETLASTLMSLTIICKNGRLINDSVLHQIASHLVNLKSFSITNCTNATHNSIIHLLRNCIPSGGLGSLTLDGVSIVFDWPEFIKVVSDEGLFENLSSLTLARPTGRGWTLADITKLISLTPLRELYLNDIDLYDQQTHKQSTGQQATDLIETIIRVHGDTLHTLGLLRTSISDSALAAICHGASRLRKFFFTWGLWSSTNVRFLPLPQLKHLEYFHVSFMSNINVPFPGLPNDAEILSLVEQCSSELLQCGFDTRVWKVNREFTKLSDEEWSRRVTLGPYDRNEIPEAFLVVRT